MVVGSWVYAGAGWRVPELLEHVRAAEDLYFDSVSRIRVPTWSRGRITLVGDAASCVSLFGDGSSLAMTGAFTLADSLAGDIPAGLRTYEARHRPQRAAKEKSVAYAKRLLIPATSARARAEQSVVGFSRIHARSSRSAGRGAVCWPARAALNWLWPPGRWR